MRSHDRELLVAVGADSAARHGFMVDISNGVVQDFVVAGDSVLAAADGRGETPAAAEKPKKIRRSKRGL